MCLSGGALGSARVTVAVRTVMCTSASHCSRQLPPAHDARQRVHCRDTTFKTATCLSYRFDSMRFTYTESQGLPVSVGTFESSTGPLPQQPLASQGLLCNAAQHGRLCMAQSALSQLVMIHRPPELFPIASTWQPAVALSVSIRPCVRTSPSCMTRSHPTKWWCVCLKKVRRPSMSVMLVRPAGSSATIHSMLGYVLICQSVSGQTSVSNFLRHVYRLCCAGPVRSWWMAQTIKWALCMPAPLAYRGPCCSCSCSCGSPIHFCHC